MSVNHYFAGDAWGIEYFAGYKFPINQYAVKSIQPYFMGDRIEYVNGRKSPAHRTTVWASAQLTTAPCGITNTCSPGTDNPGDMNPVRLRYMTSNLTPNPLPERGGIAH